METVTRYLKKFAKSFLFHAAMVTAFLLAIYGILYLSWSEEEFETLREVMWGPIPIFWIAAGFFCLIVAIKDMFSKDDSD